MMKKIAVVLFALFWTMGCENTGPETSNLCSVCEVDTDCSQGGTCLEFPGESQKFCGRGCSEEIGCPDGYDCVDTDGSLQCKPSIGTCRVCADEDGDGYYASSIDVACPGLPDCDDNNPIANPAIQVELCDGVDNDCDGNSDEAVPPVECNVGLCKGTFTRCVDGEVLGCEANAPVREERGDDCDGLDNDCDGEIDENFQKRFGQSVLALSPSCYERSNRRGALDCYEGQLVCQTANQDGENSERGCDGLDSDYDGKIDEFFVSMPCGGCKVNLCIDGVEQCVLGPEQEGVLDYCDGIDVDCDGRVDEDFLEEQLSQLGSCGLGVCQAQPTCPGAYTGEEAAVDGSGGNGGGGAGGDSNEGAGGNAGGNVVGGVGGDPDDEAGGSGGEVDNQEPDEPVLGRIVCEPLPAPVGDEQNSCDGLDNDCDGRVDENVNLNCGVGACGSVPQCVEGELVCPPGVGPQGDETGDNACDGVDDDCDGLIDEEQGAPCNIGLCTGIFRCDGAQLSCQVVVPEGVIDGCDGMDNNCNGQIDEDFVSEPCGQGVCAGDTQCEGGALSCNGADAADSDGVACTSDNCVVCNGEDDDCDGRVDEDVVVTCGVGNCVTQGECVDGIVSCEPRVAEVEVDNDGDGVDDDCDGSVDEDANFVNEFSLDSFSQGDVADGNVPLSIQLKYEQLDCSVDPCVSTPTPTLQPNAIYAQITYPELVEFVSLESLLGEQFQISFILEADSRTITVRILSPNIETKIPPQDLLGLNFSYAQGENPDLNNFVFVQEQSALLPESADLFKNFGAFVLPPAEEPEQGQGGAGGDAQLGAAGAGGNPENANGAGGQG